MADQRGYLKLTHGFPEHPKITEAGGDAAWLHICALAYCSRNLTDGVFPVNIVGRLSDREEPRKLASKLLEVGLWHRNGHTCQTCVQPAANAYLIHDYLEHQTSAARARETSEKRALAGQKGGQAKAAASKLLERGYEDASSKSVAEVDLDLEVHKKNARSTRKRGETNDEAFDAFWKIYPLKRGKPAAEKAWLKAIKDGTDPQAIIDGAILYALECRTKEPDKIKYPQGWLNDGRWADEYAPASPAAPPAAEWCGHCDRITREVENHRDQLVPCPTCSPKRRNP